MRRILSLIALLLCLADIGLSQQPVPTPTKEKAPTQCCRGRLLRRVNVPVGRTVAPAQSETSSDFYVGEAKIDVTKDETVVKLAMAQHGSVLIELPANDGPRYIIPGDPEMATVDEKALERNKRAIIVRPGALFLASAAGRKARTPAAT